MKLSPYLKIWLLAFVYTLLAGLAIQLILLPYIFPQWNSGAGMLNGLDSAYYHGIALGLYEKMAAQGWAAWQLFPNRQVVSGMSAVFYYLIAPQPWSVLPLHAALNATACSALFFLLVKVSDHKGFAFAASLPFLLFPSALQWNAQLNNDVYSVPGVILFIAGWAGIYASEETSWKTRLLYLGMLSAGFGLVVLTRPYLGLPFFLVSVVLLAGWVIKSIPGMLKSRPGNKARFAWFVLVGMLIVCMLPFSKSGIQMGLTRLVCTPASVEPQCSWHPAGWLPRSLDNQFKRISMQRFVNLRQWQAGTSNIDSDVNFTNAASLLQYLPRALQIGMFAPFPNMWMGSGALPANTLMRRISAFEMLIAYLCLAGLIPGFYLFRNNSVFYVVVLTCLAFLLLYGLVVPNIGTLYRFRFPFLMSMVSVGLFSWFMFINGFRHEQNPVTARQ